MLLLTLLFLLVGLTTATPYQLMPPQPLHHPTTSLSLPDVPIVQPSPGFKEPFVDLSTTPPVACTKDGNPGAVYYCPGPDFSGECKYRMPNPDSLCFNLDFAPQSIGPDRQTHCELFTEPDCKGLNINLYEPSLWTFITCPGIKFWPENQPTPKSMRCQTGV